MGVRIKYYRTFPFCGPLQGLSTSAPPLFILFIVQDESAGRLIHGCVVQAVVCMTPATFLAKARRCVLSV